jgi:hypothetical protein
MDSSRLRRECLVPMCDDYRRLHCSLTRVIYIASNACSTTRDHRHDLRRCSEKSLRLTWHQAYCSYPLSENSFALLRVSKAGWLLSLPHLTPGNPAANARNRISYAPPRLHVAISPFPALIPSNNFSMAESHTFNGLDSRTSPEA